MAGTLNTAMVLCAGLGTRMAPADNGHPKPLVSVRGKALLDHVLDRLAARHPPSSSPMNAISFSAPAAVSRRRCRCCCQEPS
jgi:GTP:adenosylcobinamide-phosphate guanylyltransferase